MSDLSRFTSNQPTPLTAGARLLRGFRRVGLVAGGVAGICGLALTAVLTAQQGDTLHGGYAQAVCAKRIKPGNFVFNEYRPQEIDLARSGCGGPLYTKTWAEINAIAASKPAPLEGYIQPAFMGLLMSGAAAAIVFGAFWIIGWIFAGFTRD